MQHYKSHCILYVSCISVERVCLWGQEEHISQDGREQGDEEDDDSED